MHIGLYDSGVGGLTVLKELRKSLPKAHYSYLGDTARLPYGNKAPETLKKYNSENIAFLESKKVDVIVIACHSASSVALDLKTSPSGTPIFNVITPACELSLKTTKNKKVALLSTKATARSEVYPRYIHSLDEKVEVISQEAPLLVPLVEEGMIDGPIVDQILDLYLSPIQQFGADTAILGCTHYPILKPVIAKKLGDKIQLIDPAEQVARMIEQQITSKESCETVDIYLTDHAPHFLDHARRLLGDLKLEQILSPLS